MLASFFFGVSGVPVSQGSMVALRNGHLRHSKGAALTRWRALVFKAAYEAARGLNVDVPLDGPVRLRLVFVLPRPKRPRFWVPAVKPDLDKLVRAVGDALCPSSGPRVLREDSRIVHVDAHKVYADYPIQPGLLCWVSSAEGVRK